MRKILELTEKEFLTGISPSAHVQNRGLWADMRNVTVVRDMSVGNDEVGLLQGAPTPSVNASLADTPFAYARDVNASTQLAYFLGTAGHLYEYSFSGVTATDKRSGTPITDPANGIFVMKHSTGTKRLYYFQKTQIGQWDMSGSYPTGWTDNYNTTNIESTDWHPPHRLFDRYAFGNGRYLGLIEDDGAGGLTVTPRALDFPADYRVNCVSDDGTYWVAGISTNTSALLSRIGSSKVIFWDGNQSSWSREWEIPDAAILSIKRVGTHMQAVCSRDIYAFSFNDPPQQVLANLQSTMAPSYATPTQYAAAVFGDALLWATASGSGVGEISSLGKLTTQSPKSYQRPFGGLPTQPILIAPDLQRDSIFVVCSATNSLYTVPVAGAGVNLTGSTAYAKTIYIDLQRWWQIGRVVVNFENRIGASDATDQIRVSLGDEQDQSLTVFGSVTGGSIRVKEFYKSLEARKVAIQIEFLGGSPKVRSIELWGDPIELPTHSRA